MKGPVRLADDTRGLIEVELLRHARAERPSTGDYARLAAALGLGAGASTLSTASLGASSAATSVDAGLASPVVAAGAEATTSALATGAEAVPSSLLATGAAAASRLGAGAASPLDATVGVVGNGGGIASGGTAVLAAKTAKPLLGLLGAAISRWLLVGGACTILGAGLATSIARSWRREAPTIANDERSGGSHAPLPTVPLPAGQTPPAGGPRPVANASALASLAPEIELLDRARALIDARQPREALALLDSYDVRFPAGTLAPEARVIRIQALLRTGRRSHAVELGESFLRSDATSPHAHRIRQLLTDREGTR